MTVFFWYLIKKRLYCTIAYTINKTNLQGIRNTRSCITGHPVEQLRHQPCSTRTKLRLPRPLHYSSLLLRHIHIVTAIHKSFRNINTECIEYYPSPCFGLKILTWTSIRKQTQIDQHFPIHFLPCSLQNFSWFPSPQQEKHPSRLLPP